jgi:hypothetical protein
MKNKKAEEAPKPAAASAEKTAEEDKEEGEIQSKEMRTGRHMLTFVFNFGQFLQSERIFEILSLSNPKPEK